MVGRHAHSRRFAGLTLIEMMVVTAIAAILFVAASSLMVTVSNQRMNARKRIDRLGQAFSAMTLIERDLLNTGYHFSSARFAFRVYQNVQTGASLGGITVGGTCSGMPGCIVPNTDVVEMAIGHPGQLGIVAATGADSGTRTVFLRSPGPVPVGDVFQHVFLFGDSLGNSCIGVGAANASGNALDITMLDENYSPVSTVYYSTSSPPPHDYQCPAANMTVSATDAFRRYFVYKITDGGDVGLFQQVGLGLPSSANFGYGGAPVTPVTFGIDNLQAVPIVSIAGTLLPFTAQCSGTTCSCNTLGADCVFDGGNQFTLGELVDGVQLSISVVGDAPQSLPNVFVRQRLADETMANDAVIRTVQAQTIMFRNFSQVQQ